jgi:hypothetical protein
MNLLKKVANLVVEVQDEPEMPPPGPASAKGPGDKFDDSWAKLEAEVKQQGTKQTTVEQLVKQAPGPNLDQVKVPVQPDPAAPETAMPVVQPDGKVDFGPVYQAAKLPAVPFTAEDALALIGTLPPELPLETKRQTVKVTLSAMGKTVSVSPQGIVTDAALKLAALQSFSDGIAKQATDYISLASLDIANLEAKIAERKRGIEGAKAKQAEVAKLCADEAARLDDVAEFFSLDVPPSKYA